MGIGAAAGATAAGIATAASTTAASVATGAAAAGIASTAAVGAVTAGAASAGIGSTIAAALPTVSLATGALGAGVSAYGAISNSQAQAANASYQAQVAANNQTAAYQNAEYATQAGAAKATLASERAAQQFGKVRSAIAANGLDVNSGSAAQDQETQRETGTLDTLTTVNNAALQAYGYRVTGGDYGAQAGLDTAEAAQAPEAGALSAGGGLLSSISSLGDNFAKLQQQAAKGTTNSTSGF